MDKESVVAALLMDKDSRSKPNEAENPSRMVKALDTTEDPDPFEMLSDTKDPPPVKDSWGFHLLVNCSSMNEKMDSEKEIEKFYNELIKELKMKKLTDFFCIKVHGEDGRGISAFQMITTSHISMHFDDDHRCGYLDIFSCKNFDPKVVVKMIDKYFKPKKIASQFIYRDAGLDRKKK
jgi:S-adenosylmethionine/arginine decarboxylase-like enzyme